MPKFTIHLSKDQLVKLGLNPEDTLDSTVSIAIAKLIANTFDTFKATCTENLVVDGEELFTEGNTYKIQRTNNGYLANSNTNDFMGTYINEDDFAECFETIPPETDQIINLLDKAAPLASHTPEFAYDEDDDIWYLNDYNKNAEEATPVLENGKPVPVIYGGTHDNGFSTDKVITALDTTDYFYSM